MYWQSSISRDITEDRRCESRFSGLILGHQATHRARVVKSTEQLHSRRQVMSPVTGTAGRDLLEEGGRLLYAFSSAESADTTNLQRVTSLEDRNHYLKVYSSSKH
jgi:hypothetical protein